MKANKCKVCGKEPWIRISKLCRIPCKVVNSKVKYEYYFCAHLSCDCDYKSLGARDTLDERFIDNSDYIKSKVDLISADLISTWNENNKEQK